MQPTVVSDGTQLVEAFGDSAWDLLIVDWQMPEMDGLEAVRRIRSMEVEGSRVPILLLTANAMSGDGERCTAAGADAFLFKPIRRADFEAVVRRICPVPVVEAAR
jgi:two-component system, sensor histidine kinase and response regulator